MDPAIYTSKGYHEVEISRFERCPLDPSAQAYNDPRYSPIFGDTTNLRLTEWDIMNESGVADMLYYLPSYDRYVPD